MNRMPRLVVVPLLLFAACMGGGPLMEVPRSDCEALRDHLVELTVTAAAGVNEPSARLDAELEGHRQNLMSVYGERFLTDCQLRKSPEYIHCALEAGDRAGVTDCKDL